MRKSENESKGNLIEKNRKNLLVIDFCLLAGHFGLLYYFIYRQILEMAIFNIFSVCWFILQAVLIVYKKNVSYTVIVMNMMFELLLHQTLGVYFLGWNAGFQYVLLGIAIPSTTSFGDKNIKKVNIAKCAISLSVYLVLFVTQNVMKHAPKYTLLDVNEEALLSCILLVASFVTASMSILSSYAQLERSVQTHMMVLEEENEKFIKIQRQIIDSIAGIIESRDVYTGQHTERTTLYAEAVANILREDEQFKDLLTDKYIQNITAAASLHDIGKIATPDAILNKPGRLTDDEYTIIKEHSSKGGQIIRRTLNSIEDSEFINTAYDIATYHHERWDGKGYPEGRKGEEIPLVARIVAVADVYDALVSERCYKAAFDEKTALDIIKSESGKQFDPSVVTAFLKVKQDSMN